MKAESGDVFNNDSVDDSITCKVCQDGSGTENNKIFICDNCQLAIHQECQVPSIEESEIDIDPWIYADCVLDMK